MENLVYAIVLLPLIGFVINGLFGKRLPKALVGGLATLVVFAAFLISVSIFIGFPANGTPVIVKAFEWFTIGGIQVNFGFQIDQLSLMMMMIVTGIGSLIHLYSIGYMSHDKGFYKFFTYLNLFIFSMLLLVMGSNYLILFIGWEGVGLCSYLLIGFWYENTEYGKAARKAFIMNRIGDLGLLIGIFLIASQTNALDYLSVAQNASKFEFDGVVIMFITLSLFIGAMGKSAQIPLFVWLPDAMAGPTPVSALIHAATMVTAGIFMVTRMNFLFDLTPDIQQIIAIVGAATALVAASIGLLQNDIKKVLAYSTVSQLGLMFLALGLGAYTVAVFHVITHAFFKACLFLGSGSVIHGLHGEQDMRKMGGLRKAMPITFWTMMISTLAIAGIFPFAGFWSKDEILMVAFEHNKVLWVVASIASIMTAFYMFRLMYLTFFKEFRGTEEQKHHLHESPSLITIPLVILAILAVIGGAINLPGSMWLNHFLEPILAAKHEAHHLGTQEFMLMGIALAGAIVGIIWANAKYIKGGFVPKEDADISGFNKTVYNKYYVDEFYTFLIVKPINSLSNFFRTTLEPALGKVVFSFGTLANGIGTQGKKLHNGNIGLYLFVFVLGICAIITYLFIAQ